MKGRGEGNRAFEQQQKKTEPVKKQVKYEVLVITEIPKVPAEHKASIENYLHVLKIFLYLISTIIKISTTFMNRFPP